MHEIDHWMLINRLKLNKEKTELISAKHLPRPLLQEISVVNETIRSSQKARNIGVIFDNHFRFNEHVASICKSSFYHLRNISSIRKYPSSPQWSMTGGAVVRALGSHQCGPGSIPGLGVICGLSLLLVLVLAPRCFSPGTPVFPSPQKPTILNSIDTSIKRFIFIFFILLKYLFTRLFLQNWITAILYSTAYRTT